MVHESYVQTLCDIASKYKVSVSSCGCTSNCEVQEKKANKSQEYYIKGLDGFRFNKWYAQFSVWGKIYSKNVLKDIRFDQDLSVAEDIDFLCQVLLLSEDGYAATSAPLYYYERSNSLSITHETCYKYFWDWENFLNRAQKDLIKYPKVYKSLYTMSGCYLTYLKNFWECKKERNDEEYQRALQVIRQKLPIIITSPAPIDVKYKLLFISCAPDLYKKIKYRRGKDV